MGSFDSHCPSDQVRTTPGAKCGGDARNGSSRPIVLKAGRGECRPALAPEPPMAVPRSIVMISIVVPAHDEEQVITRCLRALTEGTTADEVEVIVVCNGCSDRTADVARRFGGAVRVIET